MRIQSFIGAAIVLLSSVQAAGRLQDHWRLVGHECQVIMRSANRPSSSSSEPFHLKVNVQQKSSGGACKALAKRLVPKPFLNHHEFIAQAQEQDGELKANFETALKTCNVKALKVDHRVKEYASLKNKLFDRILGAQKRGEEFKFDYNINDVIGFRILVPTYVDAKQAIDCLQSQKELRIRNTRMPRQAYYGSGTVKDVLSPMGTPAIYEIQVWPYALGMWMLLQHDLFYKNKNVKQKAAWKTYFRSAEDASICLSYTDFYERVYPDLEEQTADYVTAWLVENCQQYILDHKGRPNRDLTKGEEIQLSLPEGLELDVWGTIVEETLDKVANGF